VAGVLVAIVSFAVGASPLMKARSPADLLSARMSLLHQVLIYAKDGSQKLVDGRWGLGQSESKLGISLSADETKQLMACTGQIVCVNPWGEEHGAEIPGGYDPGSEDKVTASAVSVLRPDLLVTAQHVFFQGRKAAVPFGRCSFRSYLHRNVAIPVVVEKDQRRGYVFHNEDFIVVRLKRALEGCNSFAVNDFDSSLPEGEQIFSVTGQQRHTLNKISSREPVLARGTIRGAFDGLFGGPPYYYADIDLDEGGSGGAVFALKDGRPVSDGEGRLVLKGILVAYGAQAKNNKPYSEGRNYTIIIGLQADFRELVEGKARTPAAVDPSPCVQGGTAKINVMSDPVPVTSDALAPLLQKDACSREATSDPVAGEVNAMCKQLAKLAKGLKRAASQRVKEKHEFRLKNDTSCPICFSYDRCNDYGCWDQAVRLSGKSTLFAGARERAPVIKNPQFCKSGRALYQ
jgi:hypothetical protein